jgi:hypothetical protein
VEKLVGKEVAQRLRAWLVLTEAGQAAAEIATAERVQKKSQATRLVELALGQGLELFHGADGTAYASAPVGAHREIWPTKSKSFRDFLAHIFYVADARAPSSQALRDAVQTLDGQARFDGNQENVYVRIGAQDGNTYVHLGDVDWRTIEVSAEGWRLINENPPVRFRRPAGQGALPVPVHGGKIDELRPFLNLGDEEDFILICAWLVAAFRPRGPYPILYFVGEQGSAKSTATRVLRRLVDPYKAELRTAPRDERDLQIAANNSHIIALDNMSKLDLWLSDAMCRLATGGGLATRELYSDGDEVLFDAQRPQLLNGIEELAIRGDFLERAIIVTLFAILDTARRDEKTFWAEFERVQPRILGALLDAVSAALKNLSSVQAVEKPRMADFYLWSLAAEQAMGFAAGNFARAFRRNCAHAHELVLDASAIAPYLFALMEHHPDALTTTTGDLLKELNQRAKDPDQRTNSWPKSARALSAQLRRLAPTLRANGIRYTPPDRKTAARRLTLSRVAPGSASSASSASAATGAAFMHADVGGTADPERHNGKDRHIERYELSSAKQSLDADHADDADLPPYSKHDDSVGFDVGG